MKIPHLEFHVDAVCTAEQHHRVDWHHGQLAHKDARRSNFFVIDQVWVFVSADFEIDGGRMDVDVTVGFGPELDVVDAEGFDHGSRGRLLVLELRRQDLNDVWIERSRQHAHHDLIVVIIGVDRSICHLFQQKKILCIY